jgi:cyanate lyase
MPHNNFFFSHASYRVSLMQMPPSDPTLYRFFEMMQVFGYPLKAIIHEKVWNLFEVVKYSIY